MSTGRFLRTHRRLPPARARRRQHPVRAHMRTPAWSARYRQSVPLYRRRATVPGPALCVRGLAPFDLPSRFSLPVVATPRLPLASSPAQRLLSRHGSFWLRRRERATAGRGHLYALAARCHHCAVGASGYRCRIPVAVAYLCGARATAGRGSHASIVNGDGRLSVVAAGCRTRSAVYAGCRRRARVIASCGRCTTGAAGCCRSGSVATSRGRRRSKMPGRGTHAKVPLAATTAHTASLDALPTRTCRGFSRSPRRARRSTRLPLTCCRPTPASHHTLRLAVSWWRPTRLMRCWIYLLVPRAAAWARHGRRPRPRRPRRC